LLAREWVRQVGQRDIPGKPALYGTTRGFLEHFNLKGLSELPPLSELRDTDVIAKELNMRLDLDEPQAADEEAAETAAETDTETTDDTGTDSQQAGPDRESEADTEDDGANEAAVDEETAAAPRE
jgi:segregation and condensation protein B